ncbi:MAG TPA: DUF4382 domain-containing protein [Acidobacteriaceae bacterium]|nr:DUF4382 domain-containing protein [Acidobacteriaceae bacterium]
MKLLKGSSPSTAIQVTFCLTAGLLLAGLLIAACGGSGSSVTTTGTTTATVMLSDPATCSGPTGPFAHVYVTITDVQANVSATAASTDSGWQDLTPGLSSQPKQIDLLGQANNQCFLATLGDTSQLQAGNYQQIRMILADNSATVANNACNGSSNCVVLSSDNSVHTLLLSSESKTGLKIPSGQIASGGFNIAAGQTKDLDIDFNTCESIVQEGNGQYRLKPVLHAGEVSTTSTSINGKVLDAATGNPLNGQAMVALEQPDSTGVDRVVMATLTGADGSFVFCPIPSGSYDIVIVGERTDGTAYGPSIITGVANGQTTGTVNLYAGAVGTSGAVKFTGGVSSQNASNQGTIADVQVSALESATPGGTAFTIPLLPNAQQPSATLALETGTSSSCAAGTDCVGYSMMLPAAGPYLGAYSATGVKLAQASPLASYMLDGLAFVPSSGGIADCSPSELKTQAYVLTSTGSFTIPAQTLAFTQCQ